MRITNKCIVRLHPFPQAGASLERGSPEREARSVDRQEKAECEFVTALLDTGASSRDYISPALAERMISIGAIEESTDGIVCMARRGATCRVHSKLTLLYMYKNVVTSLDEFFVFEPTILPQLRADLILGLHTIFANYLLYKMISKPIPDSEIGGQIQPHPDCATTVVGRASTNRAVRTQRKSRKIEEGCKRSHIAAALPSPPREGVGLGQQQQDGVGYPRQSPESHSDGEACGVTSASLKAEKDPVAAAFMSEQKCVSCAELCNTEHVSLQRQADRRERIN